MNARPNAHPDDAILQDFALGKLDDSAVGPLIDHLSSCSDCRRRVEKQPEDSFARKVLGAGKAERTPALAEFARKTVPPSGTVPSASAPPPCSSSEVPPELASLTGYDIIKELGRGGMGVVYLAHNKLIDRPEVLKVMNKALVGRPDAVERFLQEIRSAGRLSHPNVATAHSAYQLGELLVLAMEYVPGDDLAKVVSEHGAMPIPNACFCVHQAAMALQRGHELGLVHRDIKPGNILLSKQGKRPIVKVIDFGLAKAKAEVQADRDLTGVNQMMGTPGYSAPEQLNDAKAADIRSDIYALGCTLYCLLAGEAPFKGNSALAVALAQEADAMRPLREVRPEVPKALATVVARMMARNPLKRFQEPGEVAKALVPFIRTGAGEENRRREAGKPAPVAWWKHRATTAASAAALLALLLVILWADGVFKVHTKEGVLVVDVDQPNAEVSVDGEKVSVTWDGDGKRAEIQVKPGTRKVELRKDGYTVFGEEVEIEDGKHRVLTARLEPAERDGFVSLFNGRDLTGWGVDSGDKNAWQVKDRDLVAMGSKDDDSSALLNQGYLLSERTYSNFVLRFQFQQIASKYATSGVAVRAARNETAQSMDPTTKPELDYPYHLTIVAGQRNPLIANPAAPGSLWWTTGPAACRPPDNLVALKEVGEWNEMEVEMRGQILRVAVNSRDVESILLNTAGPPTHPAPGLSRLSGRIGFLKRVGEVRFRRIAIKELPATKAELVPPITKPAAPAVKIEDDAAKIAKLRQVLLDHSWYYFDNLYPPGGPCRFNANGTFHVWNWYYWVVSPLTMRVHYDRNRHDKENGILFTFNEELTQFTAEFTDPGGRVHRITGTRQ